METNPAFISIIKEIESTVIRFSDKLALKCEKYSMSYKLLNELSNRIAYYLSILNQKIGSKNSVVAFCLNPDCITIAVLIGILKSGYAYLPIDINYPQKRKEYIIKDAKPILTIIDYTTEHKMKDYIEKTNLGAVVDVKQLLHVIESVNADDLNLPIYPDDLAYMIYTSGSTGEPKGVLVEHKGIPNLVSEVCLFAQIDSHSHVMQFTSLSFDVSVAEIFTALTSGATLYIIPQQFRRNPEQLLHYVNEEKITIIYLTPSLLEILPRNTSLPSLKTIVIAGDICNKEVINYWSSRIRLINAYGPTEATVYTTMHLYQANSLTTQIGKPLSNVKTYVLDGHLMLTPMGETGELYIGGLGLARGYLNKADLTKQVFLANPFLDKDIAYLYKTGDLVYQISSGDLVFVGRSDFQVKIRGFRIELGEIESVINGYKGISKAIIVVDKISNRIDLQDDPSNVNEYKRLLAYYTVDINNDTFSETDLKVYITNVLPDYMVPARLIRIDSIPLNESGKIDLDQLKALAINVLPTIDSQGIPVPFNDTESRIGKHWKMVLDAPIYYNVDFYQQGGDSILAVILLNKINEEFALNLAVPWIFEHNTVALQASWIIKHGGDKIQFKPMIYFNENGTGMPVFMVHGGNCGAYIYTDLATILDKRIPFYGVESHNLFSGNKVISTVEELAHQYLKSIKARCPHGPYVLGGWCYGGLIAFEMARILDANYGEKSLVVLLDAYASTDNERSILSGIPDKVMVEYFLSFPAISNLPRHYKDIMLRTFKAEHHALLNYKFLPYNGHVVLIKPKLFVDVYVPNDAIRQSIAELIKIEENQYKNPDNGWGGLVDQLEIIPINGNHYDMIANKVYVEKVASILEMLIFKCVGDEK